jgi:hypothetical protein
MRKRIQHPRKQRPSRVQIACDGHSFTARVDMKPLVWKDGERAGQLAVFASPKRAEREALFALASRYLDGETWPALMRLCLEGARPTDLVLVDLLELGLVNDDGGINAVGRMVARRFLKG